MKIMNLVFHPDLDSSRVNRLWKQQLEESRKVTTSRDLYAEYPDFQIDVEREQELLLEHDRIICSFRSTGIPALPCSRSAGMMC